MFKNICFPISAICEYFLELCTDQTTIKIKYFSLYLYYNFLLILHKSNIRFNKLNFTNFNIMLYLSFGNYTKLIDQ